MRKFFQFYSNRINYLSICIVLFSFLVLTLFFRTQILNADKIKNKVQKKGFRTINIYGKRGQISDRNDKQISTTINKYDFWVNTNSDFDKNNIISLFSNQFSKPDSFYANLLNKKSNHVNLERNILFTNCKNIIEQIDDIQGLYFKKNSKRYASC